MINFKDKVAVITGATGGIGYACAKLMKENGAEVILVSRSKEKLDALDIEGRRIVCDLSSQEECESLLSDIEKIDILVCNAGITKDNLSLKMSTADFKEVIDVNLISSFILNKAAIKKMIQKRYGRIINIASVVGVTGNPGQANYVASKAGLIGMTKSLAKEVASRNITVNAVAPGFISTQMTEKLTEEQKNASLSQIPMKKFGNPTDIAQTVCFLASDAASYITGATIHVNGGLATI